MCAPFGGGIWHSCLLSQTLLDRSPKDGGHKAGKSLELANVLFNFFGLSPCFVPFLLLLLAGSHDSFSSREQRFLDGRGGRDGAARHLAFLSRFTRSCFCRLDTKIAYTVNFVRFLYSNDHLKNSSCVHSSLCCAMLLSSIYFHQCFFMQPLILFLSSTPLLISSAYPSRQRNFPSNVPLCYK